MEEPLMIQMCKPQGQGCEYLTQIPFSWSSAVAFHSVKIICESSNESSYLKFRWDSFDILNILSTNQFCRGICSNFEFICPTSPFSDTSETPAIAEMLNEYSC